MIQTDLLARFRDYLQFERRYSAHTLDGYSGDVRQFTDYLLLQYAMHDVSEATHHHVRSWIVSLLKEKKVSVSVRRKLSSLSHFYKWMRRTGVIDHNPVLKVTLPKMPERLPKSLPASAISKLWLSMLSKSGEEDYGLTRDIGMIGLLYGCGLRRSELISLTWSDYDESRGLLRVNGKGRKFRQVPVTETLRTILNSLRFLSKDKFEGNQHMQIILMDNGKPCYPKYVYNKVVELLGTVTTAENKSPHTLRHSLATHLMDGGAELNAVKAILGHASLAATQVYTHNSISRIKEVYRLSHPNSTNNE